MSVFVREGDLKDYYRQAPVTSIVLLFNIFMLLVIFVTGGFTNFNLFRLGAIYAPAIKAGEYWRLFMGMFLHGSFFHFLGNAIIGLYVLSSALERVIGSKKFALIYFLSGLGSGLLVTFNFEILSIFLSGTDYIANYYDPITIGASGAIFGALGSLLYIGIYRRDLMNEQDIKSIQGLVVINIIFTFLIANISIGGHLGGIITGFLLSFFVISRTPPEKVYDYSYQDYDTYDNERENPWEN